MTLTSKVSGSVSNSVGALERRVHDVLDSMDDARETLSGWRYEARKAVRKNPGVAIAGAFAIGFAVAALACWRTAENQRR